MPIDYLASILVEGREYCALMRAELSLQHQVRSLLKKLHPPRERDHNPHDIHGPRVSPSACSEDTAMAGVEDLSKNDTLSTNVSTPASPLSQDEDHCCTDTHTPPVPAWLRLTPKGWPKGSWHPETTLFLSPAAQFLYAQCLAVVTPRQFRRRQLEHAVAQLPIWQDWCVHVRGVDTYGLARLLCETGDLWHYSNPAKVWKRMGVGLWKGERQQRKAGVTEAEARAIGYSPYRRAIVYNLQTGLLTQNKACEGHNHQQCSVHPGPYRQLYLARKALEQEKVPEGPRMLWHRRASRYMAKRFLRDLWVAWRDTMPKPLTGVE